MVLRCVARGARGCAATARRRRRRRRVGEQLTELLRLRDPSCDLRRAGLPRQRLAVLRRQKPLQFDHVDLTRRLAAPIPAHMLYSPATPLAPTELRERHPDDRARHRGRLRGAASPIRSSRAARPAMRGRRRRRTGEPLGAIASPYVGRRGGHAVRPPPRRAPDVVRRDRRRRRARQAAHLRAQPSRPRESRDARRRRAAPPRTPPAAAEKPRRPSSAAASAATASSATPQTSPPSLAKAAEENDAAAADDIAQPARQARPEHLRPFFGGSSMKTEGSSRSVRRRPPGFKMGVKIGHY